MISPLDVEVTTAHGGKVAGLGRLLTAGARVPPGFVIDAAAFDAHVARKATALDEPLRAELSVAWTSLGVTSVAVRSSGLDEDGAEHSFAGQHDTVLGVRSLEELERAVLQCWASAFSARAVAYRAHVGARAPRMAVLVQQMIEPRCAGVVFTRSPDALSDEVIVEAVSGRGEALVSGRVAPHRFELKRTSLQPAREGDSLLSPAELASLGKEALQFEAALGEPLDLEWAIAPDGTLFWLQARPITTALSQDDAGLVWSNTNAGELLPDVATPMTLDLVKGVVKTLFSLFTEELDIDWERTPIVGLVGGRIYFSMNVFQALAASVPGMANRNPAELFGGHADEIVAGLQKVGASKTPLVRAAGFKLVKGIARLVVRMMRQLNVNPAREVDAILTETRSLQTFALERATEPELLAHLDRLNGGLGRPFHDVFAAIAVGMGCTNALMQRCKQWLGDDDGAIASALLAGLGGIDSAESGLALARVGEQLRAAGLSAFIESRDWPGLERALATHPDVRAAWDGWMERHGHHARAELDVAQPRWRETPALVLSTLSAVAAERSPAQVFAAAAARREKTEAACLSKLGPLKRAGFRFLLERARRGTRLREELKSESVRRLALTRATLLELGRRWVARGLLASADDVFFLRWAELRTIAASADEKLWRRKIARARAEHRKWQPLTPPPVVVGRLDPTTALPPPVPNATVLKGLAVSSGVLEGIARVVLRSDDDTRVGPGEILVAPFTDPGWAPYFVSAGALVVDLGGMLSHGSIIAREYGIPAVVNVGHGTRRIRSGSRIRVDGFRGEVTILDE